MVTIENLELQGLYDNKNLTNVFDDIVRLDQDEFISSNIIFKNIDDQPDITASELHVNNINGLTSSNLALTIGDREFINDITFESVKADNVFILNDFNHEIKDFDVKDYDKNRFSLTRDQTISAKYNITEGNIDNIYAKSINDYELLFIKDFLNISGIFEEKFINGQFKIGELHVDGALDIKYLNDLELNELFKNVFWIDRSNNVTGHIIFENDVKFNNLSINLLNSAHFKTFIDDIVLKNETDVTLEGHKFFENGFEVKTNLNTDQINNIMVDDILLKSQDQTLLGNVIVNGDVWIEQEMNVENYINEISVKHLKDRFKFENDCYVINGNAVFEDHFTIDRLYVHGLIDGINPMTFFDNIVGIHDDVVINYTTVFKNKVHVKKNLGVATTINGINIDEFFKNCVLISSDDYIQGLVTFTQNVNVIDNVELETDLDTKYLSGCQIQQWKDNAVYITDEHIIGNLTFENMTVLEDLTVDYLNNVDMKKLMLLHTDQIIDDTLEFGFITTENDISVNNLVNGLNFKDEFDNTVLKNADQTINSEIIFMSPVRVRKNMKTSGLINDKDLRRLVTIDTDQNLTASYVFDGKLTIDSDLNVSGKVNDIDLANWQRNIVTAFGNEEQNITDYWNIAGNITFEYDVSGTGLLGGLDIKKMAEEVARKEEMKYEMETKIRNDFKNICSSAQDIVNQAKSQIFLFKHLDIHQIINFNSEIESIHPFTYEHRQFIIVNLKLSCNSIIYEWKSDMFELITEMETGAVGQYITVYDSDRIYLAMRNIQSNNCSHIGVNLWMFNEDALVHIYELEGASLLQKSKIPGTFYTLNNESVIEYRMFNEDDDTIIHPYRKWIVPEDDYTFNKHGHKFGLSLRNENSILKLSRKEFRDVEPDYTDPTIIGNFTIVPNRYLPTVNDGEEVVMEVGRPGNMRRLTAVTTHEESSVWGNLDFINIYEDISNGILFHKISTYKPSNLNVLDFGGNGETLLVFLENQQTLQVYEYKGIEGFRHRSSAKIQGSKMISVSLPLGPYQSDRIFLLVTNENRLTIIQAVMDGDRPVDDLYCDI